MLNAKKERELAYVVIIDAIEPIVGSDNCEAAVVGGWRVMTRKGTFKQGDAAIYFEIDSKVDTSKPEFAFMEKYHGKVKTQRYTFGGKGLMISQGLLMQASDFGWEVTTEATIGEVIVDSDRHGHYADDESRFLTKQLGVTYSVAEDNSRKASSADKYKKMAQRRPEIFSKGWARWMMKRNWGKKVMFFFFGKKKDKKNGWPEWVVKTDEERIQNLSHMIPSFVEEEWIPTEKIDGTSTTFTMKGHGRKKEFYICSRNVVFDKPDKNCFYDTNVYTEMAEKYEMKKVLAGLMEYFSNVDGEDPVFVTVQGETYGEGIQKRDYSLKGHDFMAFNLIIGHKDGTVERKNPREMSAILRDFGIPCVPFFEVTKIPGSCEEILAMAAGASAVDGLPREGLVFRTLDGARSFKAVDNGFLLKYHG